MIEISREYWFSAAHQLEGHPKCGRLHGHNYRVVVTLKSKQYGFDDGMVMDYGRLDEIVKPIIDGWLDHRYIVSNANFEHKETLLTNKGLPTEWFAVLPINHSTAECLAEWLFDIFIDELPMLHSIQVDETPKSSAIYYRED